jgi:hypothetical protein
MLDETGSGLEPTARFHISGNEHFTFSITRDLTASVVKWSEFLAADPDVQIRFHTIFLRALTHILSHEP